MGCAQEKILIVDDDPDLLSGLCRQFRKRYQMACAETADAALARLSAGECFAVVVSDMRMPGMDGVRFLGELARRHPETVRIMLTGNPDQTTAIDAVNRGEVFRFLSKPCPPDDLAAALDAALERHRLQALERDLLEQTLAGTVKLLLDVMRTVNPLAFTRALTIRDLAVETARAMGERALWEVNLATLLSGLGWMSVPETVLQRIARGLPLSSYDAALAARHPEIAYEMLIDIPRLEGVARIIRFQHRDFDGEGPPIGVPAAGEAIPLGSRILRVLNAAVSLERPRLPGEAALAKLSEEEGIYDPAVILTVRDQVREGVGKPGRSDVETLALRVADLKPGDILNADAVSLEGDLLYPAGQTLTELHIARLMHHPDRGTVAEPLSVLRRLS